MTPDEIRKLMAGYATGALTEEERDRLFAEALKDQSLFDQMAAEEALRDLLTVPGVRREMLEELAPKQAGRFSLGPLMMWWKLAGVLAVAALVFGVGLEVLRRPATKPVEVAVSIPQEKVQAAPEPVRQPAPAPPTVAAERRVASPVVPVAPPSAPVAAPPPPIPSQQIGGNAPQPLRGADAAVADLVRRDAAADEKKPEEKRSASMTESVTVTAQAPLLATEAGATAAPRRQDELPVITPSAAARAPGAVSGFVASPPPPAPQVASPPPQPRPLGGGGGGNFAALRKAAAPVAPKVTDLNGTVVSIDQGTSSGWKVGDRLEVLHDNRVLVTIRLTQVASTSASGAMEGAATEAPQKGDAVRRAVVSTSSPQ